MRHIREILRQKWVLERSHREIAASIGKSAGSIGTVVSRAKAAGLDWQQVTTLDDAVLETKLYGEPSSHKHQRPLPDPAWIHGELKRPGVTLELLHLEYLEKHPDGYCYTSFCTYYRKWLNQQRLTMRQEHRAGEKLFVDYSGKKPYIVDSQTGECSSVELFVAVLGASNYTYVEATQTQQSADWINSHVRAFEYFGGVTTLVVSDQLKSGVRSACRYEPWLQRTYEELAEHYGCVIAPARPGHPRDKAKVEVGVQLVQRWILARLRHETFFSLDALNRRIGQLCESFNQRPMRVYRQSRHALFEALDQPALKPLPPQRFSYGIWKKARVNIDYHIEVDGHYYSVPYTLARAAVEVRLSAATVEIYHENQRVASHQRSLKRGRHTTLAAHMPKAHQRHAQWTPSRLIHWASSIGANTAALVEAILSERPHPEMGYRSCLGILRLSKLYSAERLEAACARAMVVRARSYRHIASMLKSGLDKTPLPSTAVDSQTETAADSNLAPHDNIRGRTYYQ